MQGSNLCALLRESIPANLLQPTAVGIYRFCRILAGVGWNELGSGGIEYKMSTGL
jgi:hypothetical protein